MLTKDALQSLQRIFRPHQIITDPIELLTYENDATWEHGHPDAVVFPQSVEQVSQLVRWANQYGVPLVARGAGTGLSGGAVAEHGGVIVEFARMDRIIEFDDVGRSVVVEPGVINLTLDEYVKTKGLYYPPDPASGRTATIGGNVAENAGGPHCFKYGVTTNYVLGLQVVLADGRVVNLGGRAFDYPEYDFAGLITGSEGTLGLITRMDARLLRNPLGVKTAMASFDSVERAGTAVSAVIAAGLVPATIEMLDQKIIRIVEDYVHIGLPVNAGALIIVEVDGYPEGLDAQMEEIVRVLEQHGAFDVRVARDAEERERLWYGRKSAAGAFARLAPQKFSMDCTVPRSRLAETLQAMNEICARHNLMVGYIMHAGDGNLHPNIPYDPNNADEVRRGTQAFAEFARVVVEYGGSISGEHGIGIEKREFMPLMCDGAELGAMWDIKQVFDPMQWLNPGKIFPAHLPEAERVSPASVVPHDIFVPKTAQKVAASLRALAEARVPVTINARRNGAVMLSTRELGGIVRYAPEDLYITVGAGMTLADVNAFLDAHGWQVPLASPWRETTAGGIVATNLNAPLRMRYGSVRDVMLCCTVALTDGRIVRAGRPLVKNVAGYDLPKVFVGSYGTLGVLTDVTFKIVAKPRRQQTLVVPVNDLDFGLTCASRLLRVAMMASAIVFTSGNNVPDVSSPYALVYTAEGHAQDVEAELVQVRTELQQLDVPTPLMLEASGTTIWTRFLRDAPARALIVRVGIAPKDVASWVQTHAAELPNYLVDVASGLVYVIASFDDAHTAQRWLDTIRQSARARGGYAVVMQMPDEWQSVVDWWGYRPDAFDLMRALKARWDPAGILDRARFFTVH
ncbi:MAG: FAD-binding oxidoreductase [Anaerolineae bacterium]|nr:FAD-binding oxidoreductase [Anaerolineae bacterium]